LQPEQTLDRALTAEIPDHRSLEASNPIYSVVARRFHWWTAALVAAQIPLGLYMANRGNELNVSDRTLDSLFRAHELLGLTILVLVVARLWYRLSHGKPPDEPTIDPWQKVASHVDHWGLYVLLIGVPLGGIIGVAFYPPMHLQGFHLPELASPDLETAVRVFYWHMVGAFLIVLFAGVHIIAATYHFYIRKDGVLRRMLRRADLFSR
jgi:cytochrome b561